MPRLKGPLNTGTNVISDRPTLGNTMVQSVRLLGLRLEDFSMRTWRVFVSLAASAYLCALLAYGQDSQSLADAARQARLQKQQKDAQAKDSPASTNDAQPAKTPRVITNDEIPEHVGSTLTPAHSPQPQNPSYTLPNSGNRKTIPDQWKSQIQAQKRAIASLQREIASLSGSIHFPVNCLPNTCAQRNERQLEKENRVDVMKQQLEQEQKRLEDLQESARKQGFGSSVYDP